MPSGKTHDRITYLSTLPFAWGLYAYADAPEPAILGAAGLLFGGLMFGPDLDTRSRQYYRWGPLRWIWIPYQRAFRHRSPWTHGLVLGLVTRLVYVTLVAYALYYLGSWVIKSLALELPRLDPYTGPLASANVSHLGFALAGVWLGGALHTGADVLVSGWKRLWR